MTEQAQGRVLITGGAGFIGTHLGQALVSQGRAVRSLDIAEPRNPVAGIDYIRGNVCDSDALSAALADVSVVYHFAARVSVPVCEADPETANAVNFLSVVSLGEILCKFSPESRPLLVFPSSAAVYGNAGRKGQPLLEADIPSQQASHYAAQKVAAENAIRSQVESQDLRAVVFRFFNVFGPGQDPGSPYSGVITRFFSRAKAKQALQICGDGEQTRDFIHVSDIVSACMKAEMEPLAHNGEAINLGSGSSVTISQLGSMINRICGNTTAPEFIDPRPGDVQYSEAGIERARSCLGWQPVVALEMGLRTLARANT